MFTVNLGFQDGWVGFHHIVYRKPLTAEDFYNGYLTKTANQCIVLQSLDNGLQNLTLHSHNKIRLKN